MGIKRIVPHDKYGMQWYRASSFVPKLRTLLALALEDNLHRNLWLKFKLMTLAG